MIFAPARCTASLPENLDKPYLVSEPKIDGSRYVLYLNRCPYERNTKTAHTLLSRRPSVSDNKFVDRSLNVLHITNMAYEELSGTVLDGEIMADNFEHTNSIMNSSPSVANQKQKELGLVTYHVFDVLSFRGKDVRGYSLEQRRKILEAVVSRMDNPYVKLVPQFSSSHIEHFNQIVSKGGEGIIVKDLRQGYGSGWSKFKKSYDISCFISGFKEGNGKYKTSLGSLALSVFDDKGKIVEVGFASGFDDSLRSAIARDQASYYGRVVDVFAQEFSKDNRLRHPTFHRIRDDLNREDCTIAKLRADMKKRSMFKREK